MSFLTTEMYQLVQIRPVLVLFLAGLCSKDVVADFTITKAPMNVAVLQGSAVELQCSVEQSEQLPDHIAWEECITPADNGCLRISNDATIVYANLGGDATRQARYGVNNVTSDQFNLAITNVMMAEDAGKYRCLSRNNAATYADAQVIILESETSCTGNTSSDPVTEDGTRLPIQITCELSYNGNMEPVIEFIRQNDGKNSILSSTKESSQTEGNTNIQYTLLYEVQGGDKGTIFQARTFFRPPSVGEKEASNAPSYEHVLTFSPLVDAAVHIHSCSVQLFILVAVILFM